MWDWNNTVHFGAAALKCVHMSCVDRRLAVTAVLTQSAPSFRARSRWVYDCANGKDGVVKAPAGQYVLRYRSVKREMQLVSVA